MWHENMDFRAMTYRVALSLLCCPCFSELTENISNWAFYRQLGIQNHQLGVSYPIEDWVYIYNI